MILQRLYRALPAVLMARRNLSRTKMRSLLAALGIVIGVLAIASLGMFGVALQYSITNELGDIGNQVIVQPSGEDGVNSLTERDVQEIRRAAPGTQVTPQKQSFQPVSFDRGDPTSEVLTGVEFPAQIYEAEEGRIPDPFRSGVLVGESLAETHDLHPGSTITINGSTERVRAVISGPEGSFYLDPSNDVIVPVSGIDGGYSQVVVTAESGDAANESASAITDSLNDRRERVSIQELSTFVEQINQVFSVINTFLLGVASISLLVAGISILNVMLMSTVERREEIGVLRAVGFQKRDVLKIMLSEAAMLGVLGGVIGIVLSLFAGLAINHFLVQDALAAFRLPNFFYIGVAFGFGLLTSVLSGLYPAWKAASEEPVEALRS